MGQEFYSCFSHFIAQLILIKQWDQRAILSKNRNINKISVGNQSDIFKHFHLCLPINPSCFLPENPPEQGNKPTPLAITPPATPTAPVKVTPTHHGLTTTPSDYDAEDGTNTLVEGAPPALESSETYPTHRPPTTPHHPPRSPSPSSGFEDSGSGEPSGDDDTEGSTVEASGDEPVGNIDISLHFP